MPDFKFVDVDKTPYLYVERSCSMDPKDISAAMDSAFTEIRDFMTSAGIEPQGPYLSVYYTYDPKVMSFRAGCPVSEKDMEKATGGVKADQTPAGRALFFVHKGPYATLRDDYALMMRHLADTDLAMGVPSWEIYVNEPDDTAESELLTECYMAVG